MAAEVVAAIAEAAGEGACHQQLRASGGKWLVVPIARLAGKLAS